MRISLISYLCNHTTNDLHQTILWRIQDFSVAELRDLLTSQSKLYTFFARRNIESVLRLSSFQNVTLLTPVVYLFLLLHQLFLQNITQIEAASSSPFSTNFILDLQHIIKGMVLNLHIFEFSLLSECSRSASRAYLTDLDLSILWVVWCSSFYWLCIA